MTTRKATEDVLARTEVEREIGDVLFEEGLIGPETDAVAVGRKVLAALAKTVEFETGTSKDPDRQVVPMRRAVITGPWLVDPTQI